MPLGTMRHHLTHTSSPLKYMITEIITQRDYTMGAKFSVVDQNAACARWIRAQWAQLKAMHAAGVQLSV
jgi:hypothetical protein